MLARNFRVLTVGLSAAALVVGLSATQLDAAVRAPMRSPHSISSLGDAGLQVTTFFSPTGLLTDQGYPLSHPDDIVQVGDRLFVAFQNGVGPTGGAASNGNTESSLVELTHDGQFVEQWDLTGKIDGLGVDQAIGSVVATVNEDGGSSLYTVDPDTSDSGVTHYCFNQNPLPHGGGTDSVAYYHGQLILSASAPSIPTTGFPAVFVASLEPKMHPTNCPAGTAPATGTAVLTSGFLDSGGATPANAGAPSTLTLTDPDSSTVVPQSAPRFGGTFMLDSQGDDEQIYTSDLAGGSALQVLQLSESVDDTAFVTSRGGALYASDPTANAVDRITGPFRVGQAFVAATPCNDNLAPTTCPAPGWPANSLGLLDLQSGLVTTVSTALNPVGLLYVAGPGDNQGQGNQG